VKEIILASQSPRRIELLSQMGLDYDIVPSGFDERLDDSRHPDEVAKELALGKALEVASKYPDSVVIGSGTIVTVGGKQLDKPTDLEDARSMLMLLGNKPNIVSTAVAVVRLVDNTRLVGVDSTRVYFRPYDETAVSQYLATGDYKDKAGSYGIQSGAAALISHIEGHYDTVVGLPTHLLTELLANLDIHSKPVELDPPVEQILP
jgi:septum formation protein